MNAVPGYQRIDVSRARQLLQRDDLLLLDSRDERAYAVAHIDNAVPLNSRSLDHFVFAADKQRPVLIYCYHGNSSQVHAQTFSDFGFREVFSLDGGFEAWRAAQMVLETTDNAIQHSKDWLQTWLNEQGFAHAGAVISNHTTALMRASRLGDKDIVHELLSKQVALQARNADGHNALWHACIGGDSEVIRQLLTAGIHINNQNNQGYTCLMFCALTGKTRLVRQLLDAGADLQLVSYDQRTAVMLASNPECGALLRQHALLAHSP